MNTPRVYVGTYSKYNDGNLAGDWLDLDDYSDADDFLAACAELHSDENDPEFMFQDREDVPDQFYSESSIDPSFWDYLDTVTRSHLGAEVLEAGAALDIPYESIEEAYAGSYDSDTDFTYSFVEDTGALQGIPDFVARYFDYEAFARDLMIGDYMEEGGHYFRRDW